MGLPDAGMVGVVGRPPSDGVDRVAGELRDPAPHALRDASRADQQCVAAPAYPAPTCSSALSPSDVHLRKDL